jgi:glycosyltransferase involved in cell wall biosynthesis
MHSSEPGEFEVVVVCNGCTDDTAALATRPGVTVIDIDQASKIAALNAGDAASTAYPRIYLDADVVVEPEAIRAVVSVLAAGGLAAAPRPIVDTAGCGLVSRLYFAIWSRLGYATKATLGSGIYAMSEAGRARFDEFPDIIADDGFIYSLFTEVERMNPPQATFIIRAPRTTPAILRRRIRIDAGNLELLQKFGRSPRPPGPGWTDVARAQPRLLPAGAVYATINFCARLAAGRRARAGAAGNWHQDRSRRETA